MIRRGCDNLALIDDREFGRAAADIDVQHALAAVMSELRGAGSVRRKHRFHVVPCRGTDQIAAFFRQDAGDWLCIFPAQCLAGKDDDPGIDVVRMQPRSEIRVVDDLAESSRIDQCFTGIGRQADR